MLKQRVIGALAGAILGLSLIVVTPGVAQALAWATYANGTYATVSMRVSPVAKVYQNRGRIYAPADGTVNMQKYTVVQNKTKGAILASTSAATPGWVYLTVPTPQTNTVARCQLTGPSNPTPSSYLCDYYK